VMDIHTVGAGGGSIAFRDRGGALRVGPRSAGGDPGPVCYGRGKEITVTDAQLYLGRLRPECFLGGRLPLNLSAAREAMARLAADFGVSPEDLALSIIRIATSHMAKALEAVSLERGLDPRDFTLCCFGGAGGLHVCHLAEDLGLSRILVPAQAGVLSALGMALAGHKRDFSRTLLLKGPGLTWEKLLQVYQELKEQGLAELAADGLEPEKLIAAGEVEMRYQGQSYTLRVPLTLSFREEFRARHERLYGHAFPEEEVEAVVLRLRAGAAEAELRLPPLHPVLRSRVSLPSRAQVRLPEGPAVVALHYRPGLSPGFSFQGPALLAEDHATLLVLPGFRGEVVDGGHVFLQR
jgi:N-methylhydantoinase A/oxoprolinase/acetone carboxylase beta subunit